MSDVLHPWVVASGLYFLDDEKMRRLADAIAALAMRRLVGTTEADEEYAELVTDFLLREVGAEELLRQYQRYPAALRDAALYGRRQ